MAGERHVDEFVHYNEPYGTVHMVDCTWTPIVADERQTKEHNYVWYCQKHGLGRLTGTVKEGSETTRLFQYTNTRDLKGQEWGVWAVSLDDLERGYKRTIAM